MLTSKDLMIGDWYALRGQPHKCTASDIAYIAECEEKGVPTDISEILITFKILENNGFKKLVTKCIYGDIIMKSYSNECWRFCTYTKKHEESVVYIRSIHELQHALRLCGIEYEITL